MQIIITIKSLLGKLRCSGSRPLWSAARAEVRQEEMFNLKLIFESAVVQGKKVLLQASRAKAHHPQEVRISQNNKLTERILQSGPGRVGAQTLKPSRGSVSSASSIVARTSGGTSIANFLRPVTTRFIQGLLHRVSNPLWIETRRRTIKHLFGQTAPYFALVGISLVSGPERGLLTAQDELEALCGDIREAISRAGWLHNPNFWRAKEESASAEVCNDQISLKNFELGSIIDKGCNAVVYAARWAGESLKDPQIQPSTNPTPSTSTQARPTELPSIAASLQSLNSIQLLQSEALNEETFNVAKDKNSSSKENYLHDESLIGVPALSESPHSTSSVQSWHDSLTGDFSPLVSTEGFKKRKKKVKFKGLLSEPRSDEVYPRNHKSRIKNLLPNGNAKSNIEDFPLAVKMMFNYEAESNAPAILNAMYKELLPAKELQLDSDATFWKERFLSSTTKLALHPNIVEMPCVFVDRIHLFAGGMDIYPEALPRRLNPGGFGRNMSLFCVMKRYDLSLAEYLTRYEPSTRTSLLLFTQLLEGILHLHKSNVAHRDLKCDNLLISFSGAWDEPHLVITDFGCSLSDPACKMKVPFPSFESDPRLGNSALMAPEVKCAIPGFMTSINFSHSDIWSAGALAFEIFGFTNPFVSRECEKTPLDSATYKETQLPKLPKHIPSPVRKLIYGLLRRNPKQRPSPVVAATICQLALWAPSKWLQKHALSMPSHNEVTKWLLCLSTKVICEAGAPLMSSKYNPSPSAAHLEYEIVSTFLSRIHYNDIQQAIRWLRAF